MSPRSWAGSEPIGQVLRNLRQASLSPDFLADEVRFLD